MVSGKMNLEEGKKLRSVFKSNLNKILTRRYKSEEQKMTLKNIKLLYESRDAVIKLFNDYSSIASKAKYKTIHGKGIRSMLTHVSRVVNVSNHSNFKMLSFKKMLP